MEHDSNNERANRRRRIFWLLLFALVILAGGRPLWERVPYLGLSPVGTRFELLDGGQARFAGVRRGGQSFSIEGTGSKLLRAIFPGRFLRWLPWKPSMASQADTNDVVLYWSQIPGNATPIFAAVDEAGFSYENEWVPGGASVLVGSNAFHSAVFENFPRRQSCFRVDSLDPEGKVLSSFTAGNPFPQKFKEWTPESLPQSCTNGSIVLTLLSMKRFVQPGYYSHLDFTWTVQTTNEEWSHAVVRGYSLEDATGNSGIWLSPREPAWKLRALLCRDYNGNIIAGQTVVRTNVTSNKNDAGGADRANVRLNVASNGVLRVSKNMFTGGASRKKARMPHYVRFDHARTESKSKTMPLVNGWIRVQVADAEDDDIFDFKITDQRDCEIEAYCPAYLEDGYDREYWLDLIGTNVPPVVNVQVTLNRPVAFGFMVNPKDAQSPSTK